MSEILGALMKVALQYTLSQRLIMTPQLQLAIHLIQLSSLDLQHEIQQKLDSNPLLESVEQEETLDSFYDPDLQKDALADFKWASLYNHPSSSTTTFHENSYIFETLHCTTTNLQEHLRWQLDLTPLSEKDKMAAYFIIDAIDENGFLTLSLEEITQSLALSGVSMDLDEIEAVRHRIQRYDPIGCAALNLAEALLIQLERVKKSAAHTLACHIIQKHLDWVAQHQYPQLLKHYHTTSTLLNEALKLILHLNPKPGSLIATKTPDSLHPDLMVKKINGIWEVSANPTLLPQLSINQQYSNLLYSAENKADLQFIRAHLQDAQWFLKCLQKRQDTLLKVGRYIMAYQHEFIDCGEASMKPLTLNDVASAVDLNESTISRATTQKYIHTPRGLFELKYFFSSELPTQTGDTCSSTAIRALLKKLVSAEDPEKPLSDNQLVQLIENEGIRIARRTIAKYRESLGIPPSYERKSFSSSF